jgi:hypothetical protein
MSDRPAKQRYLIGYDYGQGGLWAYVLAESAQQVADRFPFVKMVPERFEWMTDAFLADLQTFDVENPEGWLAIGDEENKKQL